MKVTVCICPICHERGTKAVVYRLQELISENSVSDDIELSGSVSLGESETGVNISVDEVIYAVTPEKTDEFFKETILNML